MNDNTPAPDRILTPGQVAALFYVTAKTPARWATQGKLSAFKTPGGHWRFRETDVYAVLNSGRS